jgi:hypothetical protein
MKLETEPGCAFPLRLSARDGDGSKMSQRCASRLVATEEFVGTSNAWSEEVPLEPFTRLRRPMLNVRAVEFVAKPDKASELQVCIRGPIVEFLEHQPGFRGAMVLTSHKEPRLILVLSLWKTEKQAVENHWECANVMPEMVASLIDVCFRVHTYEAFLPNSPEDAIQSGDIQVC